MTPADYPLGALLRAERAGRPDAIVETIEAAVREIGGTDVLLYLIDYEQLVLIPYLDLIEHAEPPEPASVDGTMAGRAFSSGAPLAAERDEGWHVWVPVVERANRLGVLSMTLPRWDEQLAAYCEELGFAAAHLIIASAHYTDLPHVLRRRKDMDLAAEMQWSLLPPLAFATDSVAVAGLLEPAYEVGGDSFDYALNNHILDIAVFDAMGHGLRSASLASLLMGAYRHGRREYQELDELVDGIDAAVRRVATELTFATGLLGRLDVRTGVLSWITCGHPQPLVVRNGSRVPDVEVVPRLPLGLGGLSSRSAEASIVEISLEPGDGVLFYTDGVIEARDATGELFGEDRLADLFIREHVAADSPSEVVRRLVRSALHHSGQPLRDDASMLYLRWDPTAPGE